jgi:hypothetical protein
MPSGYKASIAPGGGNLDPEKRGAIRGWSKGSARRNDLFLRSVSVEVLQDLLIPINRHRGPLPQRGTRTLRGYTFSLTLRVCPDTFEEFTAGLRRFKKWLTREPSHRFSHLLVEWQPRSKVAGGPCPHVHGIAFFDDIPCFNDRSGKWGMDQCAIPIAWIAQMFPYGPQLWAQHCQQIHGLDGWLRYLGKHGARGVRNYQRSPDLVPPGWEKTGTMWSKHGPWPVSAVDHRMSAAAFYAFRRFVQAYQKADARALLSKGQHRAKEGRCRLSYLKRRLRGIPHTEQATGDDFRASSSNLPVSDWGSGRVVARWLRGFCRDLGYDPETGEVCTFWMLPSEVPG